MSTSHQASQSWGNDETRLLSEDSFAEEPMPITDAPLSAKEHSTPTSVDKTPPLAEDSAVKEDSLPTSEDKAEQKQSLPTHAELQKWLQGVNLEEAMKARKETFENDWLPRFTKETPVLADRLACKFSAWLMSYSKTQIENPAFAISLNGSFEFSFSLQDPHWLKSVVQAFEIETGKESILGDWIRQATLLEKRDPSDKQARYLKLDKGYYRWAHWDKEHLAQWMDLFAQETLKKIELYFVDQQPLVKLSHTTQRKDGWPYMTVQIEFSDDSNKIYLTRAAALLAGSVATDKLNVPNKNQAQTLRQEPKRRLPAASDNKRELFKDVSLWSKLFS